MTAAELSALSDQQLSERVAVEVAGWRPEHFDFEYDGSVIACCVFHTPDGKQIGRDRMPSFATSADAVLPWLSRYHNVCRNNAGGGWQIELIDVVPSYRVIAACHEPFLPFAKAACIALLLAKGAA